MLVASVLIAVKLEFAVSSRRMLKGGDKSGTATSGSTRETQAAITVCTIAVLQCIDYFPKAFICMAICLANETPQFALVRSNFLHSIFDKILIKMAKYIHY